MLLVMDKFKGPTGFSTLLTQGSVADRLAALARLERLTQQVRARLDVEWVDQVRVGALQTGTLTLVINDRAHALEARFLNDQLVTGLARLADFRGLKRIKWVLGRSWDAPAHFAEQLQAPESVEIDDFLARALQRSKDG